MVRRWPPCRHPRHAVASTSGAAQTSSWTCRSPTPRPRSARRSRCRPPTARSRSGPRRLAAREAPAAGGAPKLSGGGKGGRARAPEADRAGEADESGARGVRGATEGVALMSDRRLYMISVAAEPRQHPDAAEAKGLARGARRGARGSTPRPTSSGCACPAAGPQTSGSTSRASSTCCGSRTSCAGSMRAWERLERELRLSRRCTAATGARSRLNRPRSTRRRGSGSDGLQQAHDPVAGGAAAAQELARRGGHPEIHPEHLLVALLEQELVPRLRACGLCVGGAAEARRRRRCAAGPRSPAEMLMLGRPARRLRQGIRRRRAALDDEYGPLSTFCS